MENLIDIEDVPTENAVYIADYPGTDGKDVVGDAIKDMTYSFEENKIAIRYTDGGNDIFAEDGLQGYRINLNVQTNAERSRYGTLKSEKYLLILIRTSLNSFRLHKAAVT